MKTNRRNSRARGYVLMEALVGSVILGTALVAIFHQMGEIERRAAAELRRGQAQTALLDGLNKVRSIKFSALGSCSGSTFPCENLAQVANTPPNSMRRTITVVSLPSNSNKCPRCKEVTVKVEYRDAQRRNWTVTSSGWKQLRAITYIPPGN